VDHPTAARSAQEGGSNGSVNQFQQAGIDLQAQCAANGLHLKDQPLLTESRFHNAFQPLKGPSPNPYVSANSEKPVRTKFRSGFNRQSYVGNLLSETNLIDNGDHPSCSLCTHRQIGVFEHSPQEHVAGKKWRLYDTAPMPIIGGATLQGQKTGTPSRAQYFGNRLFLPTSGMQYKPTVRRIGGIDHGLSQCKPIR